jgi:ACR3 family arsenite efflux pump ArsB
MSTDFAKMKKVATRELALFLVLFFTGLVILPVLIYLVGNALFGDYGGSGFSDFYQLLHGELRTGVPVVWLLMLSPYIAWQLLRLTITAFRQFGKSQQQKSL